MKPTDLAKLAVIRDVLDRVEYAAIEDTGDETIGFCTICDNASYSAHAGDCDFAKAKKFVRELLEDETP